MPTPPHSLRPWRRSSRGLRARRVPTTCCGDYLALWMLRLYILGSGLDAVHMRRDEPGGEELLAMGIEPVDEDEEEPPAGAELREAMQARLEEFEGSKHLRDGPLAAKHLARQSDAGFTLLYGRFGDLAPARRPQGFFANASWKISSMSRSSAYIFFRHRFSASSSFIRVNI